MGELGSNGRTYTSARPDSFEEYCTGLSLWIGTNLTLDLRLVGIGSKRRTASELSRALFAWNWLGLLIAITGGFMLFSSAATKYIPNPAFEIKLGILVPFGILWHVLVQGHARTKERSETVSGFGRFAGLFEFLTWFAVITAPVSIPNYDAH